MALLEIQHLPGVPKERIELANGSNFYTWLEQQAFDRDIAIVINGVLADEDTELSFELIELHRIQIFNQPRSIVSDILSPVFKLVTKVFSFLAPKPSFSTSADNNAKESPNNKLTGQTNIARTYQARPDIYGQVRSFPDLIQQSMFEFTDNIKYVTEWMNFGIGQYTVESVRYSESSLGAIAGASYQFYPPGTVIPEIIQGFEFDDVDGQEVLGPNEDNSEQVATATTNDVVSGTITGTSAAVKIVQSSDFDYFYDIPKPLPVQVTVNVTRHLASGDVTENVTFSASLDAATESDDGSVIDPVKYFTFQLSAINSPVEIPSGSTINNTIFTLTENKGNISGPYFAAIEGDELWVHLQAQLGKREGADFLLEYWAVNDDNDRISPTYSYSSFVFNASYNRADYIYGTFKFTPPYGKARYAFQLRKTNNSSDSNLLQIAEAHSVTRRKNVTYPNDTLVKVTVRATEQATGSRDRKYNALVTRHTISYDINTRKVDYTLRPSRSFADAVTHEWLVIGKQPADTIDLYELYSIYQSLPDPRLGYFDYTFDDEDISLGNRVETICNAARVIAYWDDGVLTFARDERKEYPSAVFNRANIVADEYKISYDMTMPGGYDGVEIEYVSPKTNKKTYIRYRITDTGIVEQSALSPLKISLSGCRNEYQAEDRALLEVNRLISSRMKMNMKTLADGEYVSPGEMIVVADTYDTNQQAGYIVARNGNNFDTSEQINFAGDMYVRVTDSIGNSTDKIRAYPRTDTKFGFTAAVPSITLNIFDGYNVQSPSRYVIATTAEMEAMRWRVSDKKPNSDGTFSLTCDEYFDAKPDYNV
ncbi:host specificity factor TipJ family phage tail protein [Hafnia alvei]|uniref:host specificity factor TipJ family phage tail protein n=1 Tax=Hafnia alvei TaxID=569 RepID=UPI004045362B